MRGIDMPKRIYFTAVRSLNTPAARYPADPRAVFILAACVISGFPLIFTDATPGTIAAQLDRTWVVIWGVMLTVGALTNLIGTLRTDVNGIILEQVGSVAVGGATVVHSGAIIAQVGWQGTVPAAIILGLGLSCFWRWGQLQALMRAAENIATEVRQELEDEEDGDA
jgi:hypothetical protein